MRNIKVGFSCSKKVGCSVVRHGVLRKMREAVRPMVTQVANEAGVRMKLTDNHNYIFVAKESITEKSVVQIREAMRGVLRKAGLMIELKNCL